MKRNSSIELLRILSMLMIIGGHLMGHGVMHMAQSDVGQIWSGGGTLNKLFSIFLIPGGRIGVGIFFIITGFFQITKKDASIKKVIIVTLFYGALIGLLGIVTGAGSLKDLAKGLIPLQSSTWWYVSTYAVLMIGSPWINDKFIHLDKRRQMTLIAFNWIFLYAIPYVFNATYYSISRCILFYLIGAFIRTEIRPEFLRNNRTVLLATGLIMWLIYIPCGYIFYSKNLSKTVLGILIDGGIYNALIVPICTICIASIFIGFQEFNSKIINVIASTTFGIYLLHDNYLRYYFWNNVVRAKYLYTNTFFPVISICVILIVFFVFCVIDYLRSLMFNHIQRRFNK